MEQRYGAAQRVWVMDRGMSSASHVAWLTRTGRRYLIGASKSELRKWKSALEDSREWQVVRDGVEAKLCVGPDGGETFLLCRSADRREKERAMHARFAKRIEDRLARLERRLARARAPEKPEAIGRQIGVSVRRTAWLTSDRSMAYFCRHEAITTYQSTGMVPARLALAQERKERRGVRRTDRRTRRRADALALEARSRAA
jgi:hypothetical protein